ncbi:reticulon-like protein B12 [Zingiber officinale]|uniref:reticulon-like protein B12 n=1 Tax=Zingiber officinale TaxID=94328 RepID=UPI001C4CBB18|nr:reticulon-like protein B12 [Zingiber officinale]
MVFVQYPRSLEASLRSLQRQRPVHEILGGGIVADVILWRRKDVALGILLGALSSWLLFDVSGYTVVSLVSNVLLLLFSILFVWTKAARIVNRPPPSIPEIHLTGEMAHEAAAFVGLYVNVILSTFNDIVKKRDTKVFFRVALYLWLISLISGFVDLRTLAYSSLVLILTVPALYEKYEDGVDRYFKLLHMEVQMYERVYTQCFSKYFRANKWVLDTKKLLVDA